ncbi:hypothetical protein Tco_1171909 [Tanacetum coccineum]
MHNNIMAASPRDRSLPAMLATGRYAQWQSRFLRYIDTRPNGDALSKCILECPYTPSTVIIPVVPATDDSPKVPERIAVETILNMFPENKEHYQSEKEAIHLLLSEIGDEIYSTVDACKTAHDMWIAIERLQQGESLNIHDVKTNLFWEFGKFTYHDGESMEFLQQLQPEWSRFMTIIKQNHDLDTVSYHKLFDVLKQYQKEVNEIHAHTELQCLYLHKVKECECLAEKLSNQTENVSKEVYNGLLRSFAKLEKQSISLELALQQCQEQLKNDTNIAISGLKKLIEKCKGKSMETKFDKPSVVRQPNAQGILKPSVLGKPTLFLDSLERKSFSKTKSVHQTNVSDNLSQPVTTQILPQTARQVVRNTNVIKPGMYRIDTRITQTRAPQLSQTSRNTDPRMSISTGIIHRTNVIRPHLRSTQMKDKVVPNNSQVKFKKTKVEDHYRVSTISNKTKSVTTCNDSLKSRISNVNADCATCGKCVYNSNHDSCVSKFLNDVNARTKKPKVGTIITRQPKSLANKSVATPPKKTVASESTIQKSKSYYMMLYEKTSKAWK